jgi:hypothetical protein
VIIETTDDVDKFLDKFEDPTFEVELIVSTFKECVQTYVEDGIQNYFMHRLLMKAYRLGKEHGYASSMYIIRGD